MRAVRRGTRVLKLGLALAVLVPVLSAGAARAQTAIGPDQHFIGLVNGSHHLPVVDTVCPGPTGPGRKGPVAGGQTLAVAEVARGHGFTGPLSQIYAWFVPRHTTQPVSLTFTTYGESQPIPTSVRVPCDGRGMVEFSPCPYLAPCVAGWTPDLVKVRFVDIAA